TISCVFLHCNRAFASAWIASHKWSPCPEGWSYPSQKNPEEQCSAPDGLPLYPVPITNPFLSTRTHPVLRRTHVPRRLTSCAIAMKYSSLLGRRSPSWMILIIVHHQLYSLAPAS